MPEPRRIQRVIVLMAMCVATWSCRSSPRQTSNAAPTAVPTATPRPVPTADPTPTPTPIPMAPAMTTLTIESTPAALTGVATSGDVAATLARARLELERRDGRAAQITLSSITPEAADLEADYHLAWGDLHYLQDRLMPARDAYERAASLGADVASRLVKLDRERAAGIDRTMRSRRFKVSYEGGLNFAAGQLALDAMERAYDELRVSFHTRDFELSAVLYADTDYQTATGAPDWAGALYDGKIRIPIAGITVVDDEFRATVLHEMAHAFIFHEGGPRVPRWLHEGLAQHLEGRKLDDFNLDDRDLERIQSVTDAVTPTLFYAQSLWRTNALIERLGMHRILGVLADLKAGRSLEQALELRGRVRWQRLLEEWQQDATKNR